MPSANFASDQAQVLVRAAKKVHTCAVGEHVVPARRSLMVGCPLLPLLCAVVQAFILAAEVRAETVVYESRFDAKPGAKYPEWSSTAIAYSSRFTPPGSGSLAAQRITNTESPKHNQRFLGEFGGPRIDPTARTRVIQTLKLSLDKLAPHKTVTVSFDLLVLKSWDGNSPQYGPDRFRLKVVGGPILLDTTFSNNPKTATDRSFQDYPRVGSNPQTGADSVNRLGYNFFGDSTYSLSFTFPHVAKSLALEFTSDLFEGKGTDDESWGLDHVKVTTESEAPGSAPSSSPKPSSAPSSSAKPATAPSGSPRSNSRRPGSARGPSSFDATRAALAAIGSEAAPLRSPRNETENPWSAGAHPVRGVSPKIQVPGAFSVR